jgi:hypothetical protein
MTGLELNQNVDIALGPKIIAEDRPKQRKLLNMITTTKFGELLSVNPYSVDGHSLGSSSP